MTLEGISREELDSRTAQEEAKGPVPLRPRDAATLLIIDRDGPDFRVLMGRRHMRHAFMPGKFVFPGGRTDPADGSITATHELRPEDEVKLLAGMGARATRRRARALALSAIRETYEEAGLFLGNRSDQTSPHPDWSAFRQRNLAPDLSALRFVARAITPPGRVRRYDTRFFVAFRDTIADSLAEGTGPSGELEELHWLSLQQAKTLDVPQITLTMITEIEALLDGNPSLTSDYPVVQYGMRYGRFFRELI